MRMCKKALAGYFSRSGAPSGNSLFFFDSCVSVRIRSAPAGREAQTAGDVQRGPERGEGLPGWFSLLSALNIAGTLCRITGLPFGKPPSPLWSWGEYPARFSLPDASFELSAGSTQRPGCVSDAWAVITYTFSIKTDCGYIAALCSFHFFSSCRPSLSQISYLYIESEAFTSFQRAGRVSPARFSLPVAVQSAGRGVWGEGSGGGITQSGSTPAMRTGRHSPCHRPRRARSPGGSLPESRFPP